MYVKIFSTTLKAPHVTPSALFSLYLTPKSVGNAEITLGGIHRSKFIGTASQLEILWHSHTFLIRGSRLFASVGWNSQYLGALFSRNLRQLPDNTTPELAQKDHL